MNNCFVISPIGEDGSQTRRQSDMVFEYIIKPALVAIGMDAGAIHRVDKSDKPTHITTEIIGNLVNYDLVIADLSDLNANVFYELGIRHAFKKPCILISDWKIRPPFDVSGINVISYKYDDVSSHLECSQRIQSQFNSFKNSESVSNPVTIALGFEKLSEKGDDMSKLVVTIAAKVEELQSEIFELQSKEERRRVSSLAFGNAFGTSSKVRSIFSREETASEQLGLAGLLKKYNPEIEAE